VVETVRTEKPDLFDAEMEREVRDMLAEAVECEIQFAADVLEHGVSGMSHSDMRNTCNTSLTGDSRSSRSSRCTATRSPFALHGATGRPKLSNFFERRVSLPDGRNRHGQLRRRLLSRPPTLPSWVCLVHPGQHTGGRPHVRPPISVAG
jgi:hypothetical protein